MIVHRYRVKGRVQGVGFRYFTYRTARSLGIKGWVKNLSNGDVEIHAEGNQESITIFRNRIESGPPLGRVSEIQVEAATGEGAKDFSIRHS